MISFSSGRAAMLALVLSCAAVMPSQAAAQPPNQPAAIPADLVRALFGASRITVGAVPPGFPTDLIPSAPVTVLGGNTTGRERTAIFAYPGGLSAALQAYHAHLDVAGFERPPSPETVRGGFVGAEEAMVPWLCRDSVRAMVTPSSGAPTGSYIRVSISHDPPGSYASCNKEQASARGFDPESELRFPVLRAPLGAQSQGGGGGSGDRQREISTRLGVTMSVSELLGHYAPQLERAGWKVGAPVFTEPAGLQALTVTDHRGREWRGALIVLRLADFAYVSVEMIRVTP